MASTRWQVRELYYQTSYASYDSADCTVCKIVSKRLHPYKETWMVFQLNFLYCVCQWVAKNAENVFEFEFVIWCGVSIFLVTAIGTSEVDDSSLHGRCCETLKSCTVLLKLETACFSEMLVTVYLITWHCISEVNKLHGHCHENPILMVC
jgi:hypothetical protein